jgi:type I restriction enzyme, R subunit
MTEDQLEQEAQSWLIEVGYTHLHGPDIATDGTSPERDSYRQVLLPRRLRDVIARLNPHLPPAAQEDAFQQVRDLPVIDFLQARTAVVFPHELRTQHHDAPRSAASSSMLATVQDSSVSG